MREQLNQVFENQEMNLGENPFRQNNVDDVMTLFYF